MDVSQFEKYQQQGFTNIPVYKELILDTETALGLYLKLANTEYSYLFESVEGGEQWGRYSIIGLSSDTVIKVVNDELYINEIIQHANNNPLDVIEQYLGTFTTPKLSELGDFSGGLVGYFGYETIKYIEPRIKGNKADLIGVPDILLMLSKDIVVFDNLTHKVFIITHINPATQHYKDALDKIAEIEQSIQAVIPSSTTTPHTHPFVSHTGEEKYREYVATIKKYITSGDCMQVVPAHTMSSPYENDPFELYRILRILNPSPYMYYLNLGDFQVVGSSPEILAKVDKYQTATVKPIAGTRPRGATPQEDEALKEELLADAKEIAEHLMLIDLGRNDLGRIAQTGSVEVIKNMVIEKYSHVMHIVSTVECKIKDELTPMDVLKATFPAGTLSGAPKVRAMQIIEELEDYKRGVYGGAVGYLGFNNTMDTAIAIRTAIIKDNTIYAQAGAGIVYDSVPTKEWEETLHKAGAIISACNSL